MDVRAFRGWGRSGPTMDRLRSLGRPAFLALVLLVTSGTQGCRRDTVASAPEPAPAKPIHTPPAITLTTLPSEPPPDEHLESTMEYVREACSRRGLTPTDASSLVVCATAADRMPPDDLPAALLAQARLFDAFPITPCGSSATQECQAVREFVVAHPELFEPIPLGAVEYSGWHYRELLRRFPAALQARDARCVLERKKQGRRRTAEPASNRTSAPASLPPLPSRNRFRTVRPCPLRRRRTAARRLSAKSGPRAGSRRSAAPSSPTDRRDRAPSTSPTGSAPRR